MYLLNISPYSFIFVMKLPKLIIFLSIVSGCAYSQIRASDVILQKNPSDSDIVKGLSIVIDELAIRGIFFKEDMINAVRGKNIPQHETCTGKNHKMRIVFTPGVWSFKHNRRCILFDSEKLKGMCMIGLFNGAHTIEVQSKGIKLHNTAFAHELFHYFERYAGGKPPSADIKHKPAELWLELFGFGDVNKIGVINKALKKRGL